MELLSGKGASGEVLLGGVRVDLVRIHRVLYVKADAPFYSRAAGPTGARALAGRWLSTSAEVGPLAPLGQLTSVGELINATLARHGRLAGAHLTTLYGRSVVALRDPGRDSTLYVAATGTPYPLEIRTGGRHHGELVFDRWNQQVTLAAPPNPIDAEQFQQPR